MDENIYRQLQSEDVEFAYEINERGLWHDRIEDLKQMLEYEPKGYSIAESNGIPGDHVFLVSYVKLGWKI